MNVCVLQYSKNTCVSPSGSPYFCSADEAKAVVAGVGYLQHDLCQLKAF